jgi:hypothetical protein
VLTYSPRRGERVYSRKCAFLVLLISSATYTECALYLPRANDGHVRPPKVPIGIFTLKNRTIGPVARLFVEYAREVARPLSRIRG